MIKKIKFLIILLIIPILSSCSGTGSKNRPTISTTGTGNTTIYFTREGGFVGGGVLAKVVVNNSEIAQLGVNEYITSNVTGNYRIKVSGAGIGGIRMGSDSISGVADGKNYFYIIGVKQGLFSASFTITETTESGYKQSQ
ncbi:hypothetical protein N9O17_00660 [Candidatus Pelagibacter sp.]|jgi:hypothetical protein|nr:hypothetical protein [Candidatus Pelagibacter sp.]